MGLEVGPNTRKSKVLLSGLWSTTSVHKVQSKTTSVDILPPRYSFIACPCARMNEL